MTDCGFIGCLLISVKELSVQSVRRNNTKHLNGVASDCIHHQNGTQIRLLSVNKARLNVCRCTIDTIRDGTRNTTCLPYQTRICMQKTPENATTEHESLNVHGKLLVINTELCIGICVCFVIILSKCGFPLWFLNKHALFSNKIFSKWNFHYNQRRFCF